MVIQSVYLTHFRNFEKAAFNFSPHMTLIVGENARGKTSLLEAVFTSVYGTGFRESREMELIQWEKDQGLVESVFLESGSDTLFQIQLRKEAEERVKKTFYVNKTLKSFFQYHKLQTQAVLFAPQHIEVITGSPSRRRVYVDGVLSAFNFEYRKKLRNYENALRKRNKILEQFVNMQQLQQEISFWNDYLVEQATYLTMKRTEYSQYLNNNNKLKGKEFSIQYIKDEFTTERLGQVLSQELRMRRTVIGPQKDDFAIFLHHPSKKNVSLFGSRSEQRMAIFWLKLQELQLFERASNRKPLLLLDDIFSELDNHNRELVMNMIGEYQTIATTTEEEIKGLTHLPEEVIRL